MDIEIEIKWNGWLVRMCKIILIIIIIYLLVLIYNKHISNPDTINHRTSIIHYNDFINYTVYIFDKRTNLCFIQTYLPGANIVNHFSISNVPCTEKVLMQIKFDGISDK